MSDAYIVVLSEIRFYVNISENLNFSKTIYVFYDILFNDIYVL